MSKRLTVLMADVSAADAERVTEALRRNGYELGLEHTQGAGEMAAALDRQAWDLVLVNGRAEANFRQRQKLDAVAQFASGVAHDFNNLLTAILAYSESVWHQLPTDSPLRAEIAEVQKSGERASALTQRLLVFGRRRRVKAQVTNLNALISSLEPALRRMLGDHVDVVLQPAPDLMPVRIDVDAFEQAILDTIGYGDEAGARETVLANPHATFLQKPFVATALVDRVREVLSGERVGTGGHSPGWTGYSPKP